VVLWRLAHPLSQATRFVGATSDIGGALYIANTLSGVHGVSSRRFRRLGFGHLTALKAVRLLIADPACEGLGVVHRGITDGLPAVARPPATPVGETP
jgi:hypothetical protein